jgi:hypothetical protein
MAAEKEGQTAPIAVPLSFFAKGTRGARVTGGAVISKWIVSDPVILLFRRGGWWENIAGAETMTARESVEQSGIRRLPFCVRSGAVR